MRNFRPRHSLLLIVLLAPLGCAKGNDSSGSAGTGGGALGGSGGTANPYAGFAAKALHVQGNKLVDTTGATVRLLGVNRAGSEYMCSPPTQGGTTFDGSTGPTSISAMLTWNINTVRLPLNEHCWLGINGSLVTAEQYRADIDGLRPAPAPQEHLRRPRPALVGARNDGRSLAARAATSW